MADAQRKPLPFTHSDRVAYVVKVGNETADQMPRGDSRAVLRNTCDTLAAVVAERDALLKPKSQ